MSLHIPNHLTLYSTLTMRVQLLEFLKASRVVDARMLEGWLLLTDILYLEI